MTPLSCDPSFSQTKIGWKKSDDIVIFIVLKGIKVKRYFPLFDVWERLSRSDDLVEYWSSWFDAVISSAKKEGLVAWLGMQRMVM